MVNNIRKSTKMQEDTYGTVKSSNTCSSKGTRMKSDLPKVVHTIEGKCLVDYAIEAAIGAAEDICLVVGYKYEVVRETICIRK